MKRQTCCFTGHRKIPLNQLEQLIQRLKDAVTTCIQEGYLYFGAGGALGFDMLAAKTILELKAKYPEIKLILVLPCLDQAKKWNEKDKKEYERIKSLADKVVYTSRNYFNGCMQQRNRHLIDNSSLCICYLTEKSGGDCLYR